MRAHERIQVEEGFLDGLDLHLKPGLNVLIGSRGTGKTSIIELIRFCLGIPNVTPDTAKKSREHATSVLDSGRVIVTFAGDGQLITVSRSANDENPQVHSGVVSPIILSQTEIETVGLHPNGRLNLLDGFLQPSFNGLQLEEAAISEVHSLTASLSSVKLELEELDRQINELPQVDEQIAALAPVEQQLASLSSQTTLKKSQIDSLSTALSTISVSAPSQSGIRFFQHPLPATPTACLAAAPAQKGGTTGLPCSI
jgi:DNA repair exonuclease SbcCD ATPase subunit